MKKVLLSVLLVIGVLSNLQAIHDSNTSVQTFNHGAGYGPGKP